MICGTWLNGQGYLMPNGEDLSWIPSGFLKSHMVIYAHDPSNRVVEKDRTAPEDHRDLLASQLRSTGKGSMFQSQWGARAKGLRTL